MWSLLEFKLNSSPRPVYSSPRECQPNPKVSLQCVTRKCPWSARPQSVPFLECPPPKCAWSTQPALECRVFLKHPTRSAQPQSVPAMPNPGVFLPREGGDVRSKIIYWGLRVCFLFHGSYDGRSSSSEWSTETETSISGFGVVALLSCHTRPIVFRPLPVRLVSSVPVLTRPGPGSTPLSLLACLQFP